MRLGVDDTTGGACDAQLIKGVPVEATLKAGDCDIVPPGLPHAVTGWSEDVELLEITAPGHYKIIATVNGVEVAPATP